METLKKGFRGVSGSAFRASIERYLELDHRKVNDAHGSIGILATDADLQSI